MLTTIHLWLFAVTLVLALVLLIAAVAGALQSRFRVLLVDRLILATLAALALTTLIGPPLLVTGHQPPDRLHFLYAALAWAALPVGRYVARSGTARRRGIALAAGAAVLVGAAFRLYMTGSGS